MARRLIECGVQTTLWARDSKSLDPYRASSASFADSPAELGAECDLVGICVRDDAGVEQVVLGAGGVLAGMAPGSVLAIHSTISLATCARVAARAKARGVDVIDAPVSGGGQAAETGRLVVMVGGDESVYRTADPILQTYGDPVLYLGALGSGLLTKLVNNTVHAAHYAIAHDAIAAGTALGIDPNKLGQALAAGSGNSFALSTYVGSGGFDTLGPHIGPLLRKDVGIFAGIAAERGIDPGVLVRVADETLRQVGCPRSG